MECRLLGLHRRNERRTTLWWLWWCQWSVIMDIRTLTPCNDFDVPLVKTLEQCLCWHCSAHLHSCKQSHLPFSAKMAAWPGPMNRPSFFNTSDPPDKKWILKSWTFPIAHLHWSSPPHPYQGRVQSWRSSDRRGSHRWSRSPCNSRTSSQTGNRNPRSFSHIFTFHLKFWPHVVWFFYYWSTSCWCM